MKIRTIELTFHTLSHLHSTITMAPSKNVRTISQEAFDGLIKENMDDLDMDPTEALQDAIETLTLQGVDLSGIVTCIPGVTNANENPIIQSLDRLRELNSTTQFDNKDIDEVAESLDTFYDLCSTEGSGNASIGTRNEGLDLVISICSKIPVQCEGTLVSAFKAMALLIYDIQSTEAFRRCGGPKIIVDILTDSCQNINIWSSGFAVVAAAATGNELVKEAFMELKIDELLFKILRGITKTSIQSPYNAIRVLLTPDDGRVVASQVYGYARRFGKIGMAEALMGPLREGLRSPNLVSASIALKSVAVNDEICKSIADNGGIDVVLQCIDDSGVQNNDTAARACCSLLSKLAGSDANKSSIVQRGGMDRLVKLSSRFSEDSFVLQEIMSIVCILSLRSPDNAARAIEAGAGDMAIQAMQKFQNAHQMQKQSCLMIRNLAVRNAENRTILLGNGIEKIIRRAKENNEGCRAAAADALRDLGLDNYNS
ncbi:hypothetical protein GIB67_003169 [Kingdonia uniflora]|uniref:Armadillo repeat-containing protein 6 n=1 Tax=Kingdonia uniflora TaxID=39325 RepID=A0A7J7N694_9MAGN|nr:hypothetical protein GIB67_003169 [Kingdonia uniflora]